MCVNLLNGLCGIRQDIVVWARKKTGAPVMRINTVNEAEEFLKKYQTFVLGMFKKFEVCGFGLFFVFAHSSREILDPDLESNYYFCTSSFC